MLLRNAIGKYITSGELPDENARKQGLFVYPSLTVTWDGSTTNPPKRAHLVVLLTQAVTPPRLLALLSFVRISMNNLRCCIRIMVRISLCNPRSMKSPYPYVIDGSELTLDRSMSAGLTRYFPTTELAQIGDETADGIYHPTEFSPLSHFDARRVDFSLARLRHYTGTPVEHFQPFVLFTNYTRYVDEFVRWGCSQILDPDSPYIALSCAGGNWITAETEAPEEAISDLAWKNTRCQHGI